MQRHAAEGDEEPEHCKGCIRNTHIKEVCHHLRRHVKTFGQPAWSCVRCTNGIEHEVQARAQITEASILGSAREKLYARVGQAVCGAH
jgi:hypothetical protein